MTTTTLICLPFAGGGTSFFTPWKRTVREDVALIPLQLPGRERRFAEPLVSHVEDAVIDLLTQMPAEVPDRLGVFGHSLGAVLAFELTRALESNGTVVDHLVVSGAPSPYDGRSESAIASDDEDFLSRVNQLAGYEHPALANPELRELILPVLRADVSMHESYRAAPSNVVDSPITALRGQSDTLVSGTDLGGWADATRSPFFDIEALRGGHMYLTERFGDVTDLVAQRSTREPVR